ncbi:MAG: hypothetical protein WC538_17735 [Thermoanaerobaculia bacterium]|jgi:hypothetical protein
MCPNRRFVTLLLAASLAMIPPAFGSDAETRISQPSLAPRGLNTSEWRVVRRPHDDVAVWSSANVIWATTIDAEGVPSAAISMGRAVEGTSPNVVVSGDDAVVFWADRGTLYQRRLLADGTSPEPARVVVSGVTGSSAARSGGTTAVLCDPYYIDATFIGSVLHVLDDDGNVSRRVLVSTERGARLAAWSSGFVAALRTNEGIALRRISPAGDLLDSQPVRVATASAAFDFAAWGDRAWIARRTYTDPDLLQIVALAPDGRLAVNRTITWPRTGDFPSGVKLSAGPDGVIALVERSGDLYSLRLDNDGNITQPMTPTVVRPGAQRARAVSFRDTPLELWSEEAYTDVFVQQAGSESFRCASVGGTRIAGHAVATSPSSMLAVWREDSGDGQIYRYRLLDASGVPTGEAVELDRGAGYNGLPSVVWSGSEFGVLWQANQRTRLLRIGANGSPLGEPLELQGVSGELRLFGGHSRFVVTAPSSDPLVSPPILAMVIGETGAGPLVTITTPFPAPPNSMSSDENPFLVPTASGWQLFYESWIIEGCVGIPCPTEARIASARFGVDLDPGGGAAEIFANEATIMNAASNGGATAVLAGGVNLVLYTIPSPGAPPFATQVWRRTAWLPSVSHTSLAPHGDGFAVSLAERTYDDSWVSIRDISPGGALRSVRVPARAGISSPLLSHSSTDGVLVYQRWLVEEHGGDGLFTESWTNAPAGPELPPAPTVVFSQRIDHTHVELRWDYAGPALRGFSISSSSWENPIILAPDARSATVSMNGTEFRVVAFNETGVGVSEPVTPGFVRRRGARR